MPTPKSIKTEEEIAIIAEGGKLLGDILARTAMLVKPGVSTKELNDYADSEIRKVGATPSFIGYGPKNNPFPATGLIPGFAKTPVRIIPTNPPIPWQGNTSSVSSKPVLVLSSTIRLLTNEATIPITMA